MTASLPPAYFEALYAANPDPWAFATSDYERGKYDATLAALAHRRYANALEVGCSIGVLTEKLAERCEELLALDASTQALAHARARCAGLDQVRFERRVLPEEWPAGAYDLIVLSEVLYYWDRSDLDRMAALTARDLVPGGEVVLVHWTGETNYPLSGDEAVERFMGKLPALGLTRQRREPAYRLERLRRSR